MSSAMWSLGNRYARFSNPATANYTSAISTGEHDRPAAFTAAYLMAKYGNPNRGDVTVTNHVTIGEST